MINFNDNNILVGYIKNLLHDFNLPSYQIDINNEQLEGVCYLEDKELGFYDKDKNWKPLQYYYNKKILNITKSFNKAGFIYSTDLHEWLGNYLRFLRDYNHLNLMRMYNCFSNNIVNNVVLEKQEHDLVPMLRKGSNQNYIIYSLPVKYNKKYTIALDCETGIELKCGFADTQQLYNNFENNFGLFNNTYQKVNNCLFSNPFIYDKLETVLDDIDNLDTKKRYYNYENKLRLFIKVPVEINTSIVILEGDYTYYNDNPTYIFDYDSLTDEFNPVSPCQLLAVNSKTNHPFADRLVEYLLDNPITHLDNIANNVKLVQNKLYESDELIKDVDGIWRTDYQALLYQAAMQNENLVYKFDILGYVDKDIENNLILNKDKIIINNNPNLSKFKLSNNEYLLTNNNEYFNVEDN